ncbi:serine/threonine protein kinase [Salpingoeca rosetta]|uniref:non-specific serine/threonine protein kinase n=1 Tax=Salpingoeca rosetta (strain ATCC 50818 / BSB-021) TaxID=946362 RepID=F2UT25_SALR5|nr:serine/threonine protein kinase [Salpingoeca rosetta]EGD81284.1 serine/threonine protein kinase [Salpingoeca rosetta]|eukprot:XP_004987680.1 serine/threonine protein kinase [Salpingoeca rosetta]
MGNLITTAPSQVLPIETYINDLADDKFDKVLQSNRFLKTARVSHKQRTYRVVKVFAKHSKSSIDISTHQKQLDAVRTALAGNVHAITYDTPLDTQKTVLLVRPFVFASLYDRMTMRPILSHAEKLWIAYQLIVALKDVHAANLCHGDIKIENVLLNSWNWVMLADFSPFKPAFLPQGQYDPSATLARIEDEHVRGLVSEMIASDASARPSAAAILERHTGTTFPVYFETVVHPFLLPFARASRSSRSIHRLQDTKIFAVKRQLPHLMAQLQHLDTASKQDALSLVFSVVLSCVRSLTISNAKLTALDLMLTFAEHASDHHRLERFLPYFMYMMQSNELPIVRAAALKGMVRLVRMVSEVQPTDANLFSEYILPVVTPFVKDDNEMCRCAFAASLGPLAACSRRFLDAAQSTYRKTDDASSLPFSSFDSELNALRDLIQRDHVMPVLQDSSAHVREAFLSSDLHYLCMFLGTERTMAPLLQHLLTLMNEKRSWRIRKAFFKAVKMIAPYVTTEALIEFLLPMFERALHDSEENVVQAALESLSSIVDQQLFPLPSHRRLLDWSLPLIAHPNAWIRFAVIDLVSTIARQYPPHDADHAVLPVLKDYITYAIGNPQDPKVLAAAAIAPITRQTYEFLVNHEHLQELLGALAQSKLHDVASDKAHVSSSQSRLLAALANTGCPAKDWAKILLLEEHISKTRDERLQAMKMPKSKQEPTVPARVLAQPPPQAIAPVILKLPESVVKGTDESSSSSSADAEGRHFSRRKWSLKKSMQAASDTTSSSSNSGGGGGDTQDSAPDLSLEAKMQLAMRREEDTRRFAAYDADLNAPRRDGRRMAPVMQRWKPAGIMVGHLHEHKGPITTLAVAPDGKFFASASKDRSIRIWDCNKLEGKAVTNRSRFQFKEFKAGIRDIAFTGKKHMMAACSGHALHLIDIKHANKVALTVTQRKFDKEHEGAPVRVRQLAANLHHDDVLAFSTAKGVVGAWDLRTAADGWTVKTKPGYGLAQTFVTDRAGVWMVTGTARGVLTLWDIRFLRPVKSWVDPLGAIGQVELFPSAGDVFDHHAQATLSPKVMTTVNNVIKVWDIHKQRITDIFAPPRPPAAAHLSVGGGGDDDVRARTMSELSTATTTSSSAATAMAASAPGDVLKDMLGEAPAVDDIAPPVTAQEFYGREMQRQLKQTNQRVDVARLWSRLPAAQRAPFLRSAKEDLIRYQKALDASLAGHPDLTAPNQPRRVMFNPEGSPLVFTSGSDCRIHYWDTVNPYFSLEMPQGSQASSAASSAQQRSQFQHEERDGVNFTRARDDEDIAPPQPHSRPGPFPHNAAHRDAITAFAVARAPNHVLISADREGVIKVWK